MAKLPQIARCLILSLAVSTHFLCSFSGAANAQNLESEPEPLPPKLQVQNLLLPPELLSPEEREYLIQEIVRFIYLLPTWKMHIEKAYDGVFRNIDMQPWSHIKISDLDKTKLAFYQLDWISIYLDQDTLVRWFGASKATDITLGEVVKYLTTQSTTMRVREKLMKLLDKEKYMFTNFINQYLYLKEIAIHIINQVHEIYKQLERAQEKALISSTLALYLKSIDEVLVPSKIDSLSSTNTFENIYKEYSEYMQVLINAVEEIKNIDYSKYILYITNNGPSLVSMISESRAVLCFESMVSALEALYTYLYDYENYKLNIYQTLPIEELALIVDDQGQKPAQLAIKENNLEALKDFLKKLPIFLNDLNKENKTLLHLAAENGQEDIVTYLMHTYKEVYPKEFFSFLSMKTIHQATVAFLAAYYGHLKVLNLLLCEYPDLALERDIDNNTLLHTSAGNGQLKIVIYLCEQVEKIGIDLNAKNNLGRTALLVAAYENRYKVARYLEQHKAIDKNIKDKRDRSFHEVLGKQLEDIQNFVSDPEHVANLLEIYPEYRHKEKDGINLLETRDLLGNGDTIAHSAAYQKKYDALLKLLSYNSHLGTIINKVGDTVAHIVARDLEEEVLEKILKDHPERSSIINKRECKTPYDSKT